MKTKLVLAAVYAAFVCVCFVHWRRAEELATTEVQFLEGTRHAAQAAIAQAKTIEEAQDVVARTVRRFDVFEKIARYQSESTRSFVYLALVLTLPLVVVLGRGIRSKSA